MWQGIIEEVAKIEIVLSRTGGREGLLWQGIIKEMAKMRECPAKQVAERGFCERQRIDGRKWSRVVTKG